MLGRLYGLYRAVIDTIRGYGDYLWSSVVSQVLDLGAATRATFALSNVRPAACSNWPYAVCQLLTVVACYQSCTCKTVRVADNMCCHVVGLCFRR